MLQSLTFRDLEIFACQKKGVQGAFKSKKHLAMLFGRLHLLRSRQKEGTDSSFLFKFSQALLDLLRGIIAPCSQKLLQDNSEAPELAGPLGDQKQSRHRSMKPSTVWFNYKHRHTLAHIKCTLL